MRSFTYIFVATCLTGLSCPALQAHTGHSHNETSQEEMPSTLTAPYAQAAQPNANPIKTITPFTGKVTKEKVRMRLQPSLDSAIVRELKSGDLLIVIGESDDFYAIEPPSDIKAYIYRTFVLDGVVEGSRVNVRLAPVLDAPVIAQVNSGEPVINGNIAGSDKKWIEFNPPASTRFYVAKDYVIKIGDKSVIATMKRRREDVNALVTLAAQTIQSEMRKPFDQINIDESMKKLQKAATEYTDYPEESSRAKAILAATQEAYLQKKVAYMEAKVNTMAAHQAAQPIQVQAQAARKSPAGIVESDASAVNSKMTAWKGVEQQLFDEWAREMPNSTMDDFYREQSDNAVVLQGVIEPYDRNVRNKPGDFVLVTQTNHLPIAYLYSSQVNLQNKVGQAVAIKAVPRNNNNFAFPAYFVISVQ